MPVQTIAPRCGRVSCSQLACRRSEADFNEDGYDRSGYDRAGFDINGYNVIGRDSRGYDREGYDREGYDREGYDSYGYNIDGYDRDGYNSDGYNTWGERRRGGYYDDDDDDYRGYNGLHGYSYTPELEFRGDAGPYFGMEIEITTDEIRRAVDIFRDRAGSLVWCKSDSSVDGLEAVTHPMSYAWAMENFPWDVFPALRSQADCSVVPQENGIHIHVGRTAFKDAAHTYRWMKLWYRNPNDIQRIARRRNNAWGEFRPDHRAGQLEHVKRGKRGYNRGKDDTLRTRYAAINTTNDKTLEIRVFASSLRPQRVKAALQLVAASVEYTRNLSADAVCKRHGWDWQAFMAWVRHDGSYPDLVAEDRIRRSG